MANYYNLIGWRHTGFNAFNRPYSRDVLETEYFKRPENYFQMEGIAVKRDDMDGLNFIDLPGSVKDYHGNQLSPPNATGTHGPGGPWYSWEEVDYIRLVRTGYPGDEDYVDISGNMADPWNAPRIGKLFTAYYFVTGLEPIARNVTRLYLSLDEWTTLGGASELTIETGFKIRGPVTDAEDASSYNMASENIGLIEPLVTVQSGFLNNTSLSGTDFICSSIDLTQYSEGQDIDGFVAATASGQMVFPAIKSSADISTVEYVTPWGDVFNHTIFGFGIFAANDARVKHNLSVLYSAGQLELQDSYTVPNVYIEQSSISPAHPGQYLKIKNAQKKFPSPVSKDISGYPRKADYLFGQEVLYGLASGTVNIQPFSELSDDSIMIWANPLPSGSPLARFKDIKEHPFNYDQLVSGITWVKKAVVMQGASGSMWTQINNQFAQQTQARDVARYENEAELTKKTQTYETTRQIANMSFDTLSAVNSGIGISLATQSGREKAIAGARAITNAGLDLALTAAQNKATNKELTFKADSLAQAQNQLNAAMAQSLAKAPYASFVPDLTTATLVPNGFGVSVINTSAKDRARLKNYFRRYGYSGQYKKLTWAEIDVKQKVNFIQCEGVTLIHTHYPMRMTDKCARLLEGGVFLWKGKPEQSAFENNPDN